MQFHSGRVLGGRNLCGMSIVKGRIDRLTSGGATAWSVQQMFFFLNGSLLIEPY